MRLALSAALLAAFLAAACAGDSAERASPNPAVAHVGALAATTPTVVRNATAPIVTSTSLVARSTSALETSVSPSTVTTGPTVTAPVQLAGGSPPTSGCVRPSAVLKTASGRRVVLRTRGLIAPSPTIIVMHGYTGSPDGIEKFSELTSVANAAGVAVMYPQGTPTPSGGYGWSTGAALFATSGTDDVAALQEMIDAAVRTGCVNPARLIISGESNGAGMALVALCDERLQHTFAAAVLVIPAIDDALLTHCNPTDTVPIGLSVVAGKLDQTVGYDVGRPPFLPAEQWFDTVGNVLNACPPKVPDRAPIDSVVERIVLPNCTACTELFAIADGSHTWPGSSEGSGGLVPGSFDLSRRLIDLATHPEQTCLE